MRDCYLCSWYWKLKQRRGAKKAIIALARKILVIIYNILKYGSSYDEEHFELVQKKQHDRRKKSIIAEAKKLGLTILDSSVADTA
jgi:transposase